MATTSKYKIVRIYANDGISNRTIKSYLTLEQAQEHCRSPETSSRTATSAAAKARTRRLGEWMDTYEEMPAPRIFIQRIGNGYHETVDEFSRVREAMDALRKYRLADPSAEYYLSRRACGGWDN